MSNTIKVIGFDLDDTLWSVAPVIEKANSAMWSYLNTAYPKLSEKFSMLELLNEMQELTKFDDRRHKITLCRMVAIQTLLERAGLPIAKAVDLSGRALDVFLEERHNVDLYAGALDCISKLKKDYKIASISNGNANTRRLGLAEYFDFSICAEDINSSKPEPALFETTLIHFGIKAEEMIYIGDGIENDVSGAKAVGIHPIWFNKDKLQDSQDNIEHVAHNYDEVLQQVKIIAS